MPQFDWLHAVTTRDWSESDTVKEGMAKVAGDETIGGHAASLGLQRAEWRRIVAFVGWVAVTTLVFIRPLLQLMMRAGQSSLLSYIPLIPWVSAYMLYTRRSTLSATFGSSFGVATTVIGVGITATVAWLTMRDRLSVNDGLALMAVGYVSFVAAGGFLLLGSRWMARAAFPISFLMFIVPLPDAAVTWLENALVLASAEVSGRLFAITGTPLIRDGTIIRLPGIVLEVARECSGIRSTWVLFITSLLASELFLKSPWRRLLLVVFVIPLGIIRNGVRILTVGLLCVHIGPHMIDGAIHRRGGPLFFALSLGPLFLLLAWLRRQES